MISSDSTVPIKLEYCTENILSDGTYSVKGKVDRDRKNIKGSDGDYTDDDNNLNGKRLPFNQSIQSSFPIAASAATAAAIGSPSVPVPVPVSIYFPLYRICPIRQNILSTILQFNRHS